MVSKKQKPNKKSRNHPKLGDKNENIQSISSIGKKSAFRRSLYRLRKLIQKEMILLLNDKIAIILLLILPVSVILFTNFNQMENEALVNTDDSGNVLSSMGIRFSTPKIGIIDEDNSEGFAEKDLSQEFVRTLEILETDGDCDLIRNKTYNEYEQMLGIGELNGYIIIQEGFEYNISVHFVAMFKVVVDAYDNFVMQDVLSIIGEALANFKTTYEFTGAIDINTNYVNIPQNAVVLRSFSPYFYPLLVMALPILVESQSIIGDKPKDRMLLTPTNKREIFLAKFFGGTIINSSLAIVVTATSLILGLEIQSSMFLFFLTMELTVIIGATLGIFISSVSKSSLQGFQYSLLVIIFQEILMLFITNDIFLSIFPLFSVQEIYRLSVLKGIPILDNQNSLGIPYIAILAVELIIIIVIANFKFKRIKGLV